MDFKKLRKARGWSQMTAAREVGVSFSGWILWERGGATPNQENLEKLKKVFGLECCTPKELK